jgi:hypothetical protein
MLARSVRRPVAPTIEEAYVPAPVGGLNTVSAGGLMPALDCPLLWNMVSAENGLRSRLGSREWCTEMHGVADDTVRTLMSFKGSTASGTKDRVFATTSSGIFDVTSSGASPSYVLAFATQTGNAGRGVAHAVVTAAGHFLLYCDEVNGLHVYTESTDTWAAVAMGGGASQISGVDPATFRFAFVYKNRVCFAAADSQSLYYLDPAAIYGAATAFPLRGQFRNGGHLVGGWNWTYDGGNGVDDALVLVSSGGDVVIYVGSDVSSASTIALRGVWSVPGLPSGRDIASSYGGDLVLLTKAGLLPLSRLVAGSSLQDSETYATHKISNLFNQLMLSRSDLPGWSIRLNPEDNTLLVTVPTYENQPTEQLAMSVAAKSWSRYSDLPIYSSVVHAGKLYYGTVDGKVGIHDGYIDGVTLDDPNAYSAIQWRCLTAFRNLGNGRQKQVHSIRPTILSESSSPAYDVQAKYRYDMTELATVNSGPPASGDWDGGVWDTAVWGDGYSASQDIHGAVGMGVDVAIAIRGAATSRTVLVGFDVAFEQGGWL